MTTRGCSWIPLPTRRLIPSWRSPHRTPRISVAALPLSAKSTVCPLHLPAVAKRSSDDHAGSRYGEDAETVGVPPQERHSAGASSRSAVGAGGLTAQVYNLHADKRGDVDNLDTNTTSNRDLYTGFHTGFELSFNARIPGGGNLFSGVDFGRETFNRCDSPFDPNTFRFCDTTGGDGEALALARVPNALPGIGLRESPPYLAAFKIAGDSHASPHFASIRSRRKPRDTPAVP